MTATPEIGLLLDVDGPVASPVTRSISRPGVLAALVDLARAGVPLVFNTGRSDEFVRTRVLAPLRAAGVPAGARVHAVCEKGAVHLDAAGEVVVDADLAVPAALHALVAEVAARYAATMFVDRTKRAMVSVEQRVDVPAAAYAAVQGPFEEDVLAAGAAAGYGIALGGRSVPDARGAVPYRIDPTVIAVDVESARLGKDLGAEVALGLLAADGELPRRWRTVGDSRTDYAMADLLHARGLPVAHVDVRPADGVPPRDYPVLVPVATADDEAGEAYLARVAALVRGEADDEVADGLAWSGGRAPAPGR